MVTEIDRIATLVGRDANWVMQRALSQYFSGEGAEIHEDALGIAELEGGESSAFYSVLEKARAMIDAAEFLAELTRKRH